MSRALEHGPCTWVEAVLWMSQSNECRLGAFVADCRKHLGRPAWWLSVTGSHRTDICGDSNVLPDESPWRHTWQMDLGSGVGSWLVYLHTTVLTSSSVLPPLSSDNCWLKMRPCTHEWMARPRHTNVHVQPIHTQNEADCAVIDRAGRLML